MDNKYQIPKKKKPETRAEILQQQIEELVKKRDKENDPAAKQALHKEIMGLYAQWERAKL
ncbi:hypothetical protein BH20ACI2_BH20ACI2_06040 [soil metagenome]